MNILYHHRTQGTGAEGVHIGQVIKSLREIGHTVDVVSPNDADPTQTAGNNPYAKKPGFKARALDQLSRMLPQFLFELLEFSYNIFAGRKLRRLCKEKSIDLIYERAAFFLFAGARIAKEKGIPYIVEVNEVAGEDRIRQQFFIRQAKKIEQEVFQQADAIIVVSSFLKNKIKELGVDGEKIHVIPNAADASIFSPDKCTRPVRSELGIKKDTVVVGFIGWFVAWHNFELLIKAISRLKNIDIQLMLVGDGPLKDDIISVAEAEGVADRLVFPGAIKYPQIPEFVNAMDICVIPGSNAYRSPIKLFEYMIMGKPVVAPALEPIEYIVENNKEALLFQPDDMESLSEALRSLAGNNEERHRMGAAARALILDRHLWIHNAQRVISIYDALKVR